MTKLRLVLLATTAISAMPGAGSALHAETARLVVAQQGEPGQDGKHRAAPKAAPARPAPPAAAPPRQPPAAAPPRPASPPPRAAPPPHAAPPAAAPSRS